MDFKQFISQICKEYTLQIPKLFNNQFSLKIDDQTNINFEFIPQSGFLYIYAFLFPEQSGRVEEFSKKLLEYNTFGRITGSSVISFSPSHHSFVLSERFELDTLQIENFLKRLQTFIASFCSLQNMWPQWHREILESDFVPDLQQKAIFRV